MCWNERQWLSEEADGGRKGGKLWASWKTQEEAVPCVAREDMSSLQVAACTGGRVTGEAATPEGLRGAAAEPPGALRRLEDRGGRAPLAAGAAGAEALGRTGRRGRGGSRRCSALPEEAGAGPLRTAAAGTRRSQGAQGSGGKPGPGGASPPARQSSGRSRPAAVAAAGRRGCGRPAWEGLSGGPSPGADGAAAAAAAIRRRGSRCPAWEGPCCIAAAALLPLRAHNGDSEPEQRLRRRERAGPGRSAGARRRQQHAG